MPNRQTYKFGRVGKATLYSGFKLFCISRAHRFVFNLSFWWARHTKSNVIIFYSLQLCPPYPLFSKYRKPRFNLPGFIFKLEKEGIFKFILERLLHHLVFCHLLMHLLSYHLQIFDFVLNMLQIYHSLSYRILSFRFL